MPPYAGTNSFRYGLHYGGPVAAPAGAVVLTDHTLVITTTLAIGTGGFNFGVALGTGIGNTQNQRLALFVGSLADPNDPLNGITSILLDGVELMGGDPFIPAALVVGNNGLPGPTINSPFSLRFNLLTEWLTTAIGPDYEYESRLSSASANVFANMPFNTWRPQRRVLPTVQGAGFLLGSLAGDTDSVVAEVRDPVTLTVLATSTFTMQVTGV